MDPMLLAASEELLVLPNEESGMQDWAANFFVVIVGLTPCTACRGASGIAASTVATAPLGACDSDADADEAPGPDGVCKDLIESDDTASCAAANEVVGAIEEVAGAVSDGAAAEETVPPWEDLVDLADVAESWEGTPESVAVVSPACGFTALATATSGTAVSGAAAAAVAGAAGAVGPVRVLLQKIIVLLLQLPMLLRHLLILRAELHDLALEVSPALQRELHLLVELGDMVIHLPQGIELLAFLGRIRPLIGRFRIPGNACCRRSRGRGSCGGDGGGGRRRGQHRHFGMANGAERPLKIRILAEQEVHDVRIHSRVAVHGQLRMRNLRIRGTRRSTHVSLRPLGGLQLGLRRLGGRLSLRVLRPGLLGVGVGVPDHRELLVGSLRGSLAGKGLRAGRRSRWAWAPAPSRPVRRAPGPPLYGPIRRLFRGQALVVAVFRLIARLVLRRRSFQIGRLRLRTSCRRRTIGRCVGGLRAALHQIRTRRCRAGVSALLDDLEAAKLGSDLDGSRLRFARGRGRERLGHSSRAFRWIRRRGLLGHT
eukprot:scaffold319_cov244-Pinguiococcus_pyrenoidosus.AAC.24